MVPSEQTLFGGEKGGRFEAVAVDNSNLTQPIYFVTEDVQNGALRKYKTPKGSVGWDSLHESGGEIDYLNFLSENTFEWTASLAKGRKSAFNHYQNTEGITFSGGKLYFVAKRDKKLIVLDLRNHTYNIEYTDSGLFRTKGEFDAQPDQVVNGGEQYVCFTEDGGSTAGVYCRNIKTGVYVTIFEVSNSTSKGKTRTVCYNNDG